jgi:phage/plasmid-associated DNA primase
MLQMLSGQDSIDAERKGVQERFKFKDGAKMTMMGNKFQNVDKPTDAFWERLKLCKFRFGSLEKNKSKI